MMVCAIDISIAAAAVTLSVFIALAICSAAHLAPFIHI